MPTNPLQVVAPTGADTHIPEKPTITSGIRIGSPAGTTRGFGIAEFRQIGRMMAEVLDGLAASGEAGNARLEAKVKAEAIALTERFPIYA